MPKVRNPRTGAMEETDYTKQQKGPKESEINPGGLGAAAAANAEKKRKAAEEEKAKADAQAKALKEDKKEPKEPKS